MQQKLISHPCYIFNVDYQRDPTNYSISWAEADISPISIFTSTIIVAVRMKPGKAYS